jgi:hypothetical protein
MTKTLVTVVSNRLVRLITEGWTPKEIPTAATKEPSRLLTNLVNNPPLPSSARARR